MHDLLGLTEIADFGLIVLVVAAGLMCAVLIRSVTDRFAFPAAALFLIGAAVAAEVFPEVEGVLTILEVERIAVVALIVILFDGGLHIGLRRFRAAAAPILAIGVLGTFATAGLLAVVGHYLLGFDWVTAGLLGAALAPTDPAVTFSVLGGREIRGRTGTILEGESGANDPVGIALMIGMIEFATTEGASFSVVIEEFLLEMTVGLAVGIAGAVLLLPLFRRVRLLEPPLYPLRVLAGAGLIYGIAAVAHGSGFIAVFAAGILLGDSAMPRKGEIESFHKSLAGMAEIAVFAALGLTIDLDALGRDVWIDGVVLFLALALVVRPLVIGGLLLPARIDWGERLFLMWGGLKGAVPILLAALAVISNVDERDHIYSVVFVAVLLSVVIQGTSIPHAARFLGVPFRRVEHAEAEVRPFVVGDAAFATGKRLDELPLSERAWVGAAIRGGQPLRLTGHLVLLEGDVVDVYCEPSDERALRRVFEGA